MYLTEISGSSEYPLEEIEDLEYIITTSGSTGKIIIQTKLCGGLGLDVLEN